MDKAIIGDSVSPLVRSRSAAMLTVALLSYLMIVLDVSIVFTALPRLQRELGFSATSLSWVQTAYSLPLGGLLLVGARAADLFGRRRMLIAGLALFTAASLAVGLAPSSTWLIIARAAQGTGAAVLVPTTLTVLTTGFPAGRERTRALAYHSATAGLGSSAGPLIGGACTDLLSWRVGFFLNVPIGIAMIAVAAHVLPRGRRLPGRLDIAGAALSCIAMTALVFGLVRSAGTGWADPITGAVLTAGIGSALLFVRHERRANQPIIPLRLFASPIRCGAYATRALFIGVAVGFWFFTTQYLHGVLELSPFQTGLAFLPNTVATFAAALLSARLAGLLGAGRLLALGLTLSLLGIGWLSLLSADTSYSTGIAPPLTLIGLGTGLTLGPLTEAGTAHVDPADTGAASGLTSVAHQFGGALGLTVLVTVYAATDSATLDATASLAHRTATVFTVASGMLVLALVTVVAFLIRPGFASDSLGARHPPQWRRNR